MRIIKSLIFIGLFSLWLYSLVFIVPQTSFSVLSKYEKIESFLDFSEEKILEGQKIIGEFVSKEDNLGIISVRFNVPNYEYYDEQDIIEFRLREKGAEDWYAENTYTSGLLKGSELFPFGFPPIKDSKGKTYTFEIESQKGTDASAIALSSKKPVLITQYQYSLPVLIKDPVMLVEFLIKKVTNSLQNGDMFFASLPYLLPLVLLTIWLIFSKKIRNLSKKSKESFSLGSYLLVHIVIASMFFVTIVGVSETHFSIYLIIIAFWIATTNFYKFDSTVSFLFSFGFFIISVFGILIDNEGLIQKSTTWVYILLLIGIIQALIEKNKKNRVDYKQFLSDTFGK